MDKKILIAGAVVLVILFILVASNKSRDKKVTPDTETPDTVTPDTETPNYMPTGAGAGDVGPTPPETNDTGDTEPVDTGDAEPPPPKDFELNFDRTIFEFENPGDEPMPPADLNLEE